MQYVDGFIVAVPKANIEAYKTMSKACGAIWMEHGALEYRECVADDVKSGELTSFPKSVMMKPDETVVFSWILYASRADRDAINDKVMADPRMKEWMSPNVRPFDGKRMIYGGFETLLKL